MKKTNILIFALIFCLTFVSGCQYIDDTVLNIPYYTETEDVLFDTDEIPDFTGEPFIEINNNIPFFSEEDMTTEAFEDYSMQDSLGRCRTATANICIDIMPTEKRESIGQVKPSGSQIAKYDSVDGQYLYNRCHLIGYQLSGENANEENLITGTRYMNTEGMLPFENMVADYVEETENHVLYRVTPVYEGSNLLATGVLMEAFSVEDNGEGICFNVFCYNEQPGIKIDHATGENELIVAETVNTAGTKESYAINIKTGKFHLISCDGVSKMSEKNKKYINCTREELISGGYKPCGSCNP